MEINWETKLYCLIGHPISKSLSPIIHNNFYKLNGINSVYLTFDVEEDLENIPSNSKLIIRSHGVGEKVYTESKSKNMEIVDTTKRGRRYLVIELFA